jgi:predicted N-acetyltransferase YhbS
LTDKVLWAYIPLIEVIPDYRGKGIGKKLVCLMLERLKNMYAIDICCDEDLETFYRQFGFRKVSGMIKRRF